MDGLAATRKLRQLQVDGLIDSFPIIAATCMCNSEAEHACIDAGMDAMLSKPMELDVLADRLSRGLADYHRTARTARNQPRA
jgi:CheY-like chemotaxis protein